MYNTLIKDRQHVDYQEVETKIRKIQNGEKRKQARFGFLCNNCVVKYKKANDDTIKALEERQLYVSTALGYNDPYDSLMYINIPILKASIASQIDYYMPSYLDDMPDKTAPLYRIANALYNQDEVLKQQRMDLFLSDVKRDAELAIKHIHDNVPGICFSKDPLSTLMWAHYAEDHTGFALLYDIQELESATCISETGEVLRYHNKLYDVEYSNLRPDGTGFVENYILFSRIKENSSIPRSFYGTNPITYPNHYKYSQSELQRIILTQSEAWSYEKEARLLFRPITPDFEFKRFNLRISPRGIILGAKMDSLMKQRITEIAKKLGCTLYEAWINNAARDYNVVIQEVV